MKRKNTYLVLTIIGTILPNIFVLKESLATGNILLYANLMDTLKAMFASDISSAFITDLLFVVVLFFFWSFKEAKRYKIKGYGWAWLYTMTLGLAGGLPFFLYLKETQKK